jgi:hypothetical protein
MVPAWSSTTAGRSSSQIRFQIRSSRRSYQGDKSKGENQGALILSEEDGELDDDDNGDDDDFEPEDDTDDE